MVYYENKNIKVFVLYKYWQQGCLLRTKLNKYFLSDDTLKDMYDLSVRKIDYENTNDLETWCEVINSSYDDCLFTVSKAKDYLNNHLVLADNQTFVFVNGAK